MDNTQDIFHRLTSGQIANLLDGVQDDIRKNRPLVLERAGKSAFTTKQHDGSPVTATDVEVEELLMAAIAQRSGILVFGEETGYGDNLPKVFWLVDPIDGTKSFIEGVPAFTTMAVLIECGEAVASLIYNHSTDDMFTAQKGRGAYKNGVRLDLTATPLPRAVLCKDYLSDALNGILSPAGVAYEEAPSGAGYGFSMVADGRAAARFNLRGGGYTHDYAPGALLVQEAGGVIVPIKDEVYTYTSRSFVACHPELETVIRANLPAIRALER